MRYDNALDDLNLIEVSIWIQHWLDIHPIAYVTFVLYSTTIRTVAFNSMHSYIFGGSSHSIFDSDESLRFQCAVAYLIDPFLRSPLLCRSVATASLREQPVFIRVCSGTRSRVRSVLRCCMWRVLSVPEEVNRRACVRVGCNRCCTCTSSSPDRLWVHVGNLCTHGLQFEH